MLKRFMVAVSVLAAVPAMAAEPPAQIKVLGEASVVREPDIGTATFTVRGEGTTSEAAIKALLATRKATDAAVAAFGPGAVDLRTGELSTEPARSKACDTDAGQTRLSGGDCAIQGYVAELTFTARMEPRIVGTLVSAVSRAGATSAQASRYGLRDETDALQVALAEAAANGRKQAELIAKASGRQLGRLVRLDDGRTAAFAMGTPEEEQKFGFPPPAAVMLEVEVKPEPVQITSRVVMVFELLP